MTGELDPWQLNLHTKMRPGGNGMWGRGPAQRKQSLKKKKKELMTFRSARGDTCRKNTTIKDKKIFLIYVYEEIRKVSGAMSSMTNGLLIID